MISFRINIISFECFISDGITIVNNACEMLHHEGKFFLLSWFSFIRIGLNSWKFFEISKWCLQQRNKELFPRVYMTAFNITCTFPFVEDYSRTSNVTGRGEAIQGGAA